MSFFKFDEENVSIGFELVAEGKYEAIIINANAQDFQGHPTLNLDFEIRSDVPQAHQGAKILYNTLYFHNDDPEYKENNIKRINSLIKACGFPNGVEFKDSDDMAKQLFNKNLVITVKHQEDKKDKSKKYAKARFFDASKVSPPEQAGPSITICDDDIPF
ncbi:DUF669 domain-containing protein [Bacillus sp. ISL-78]|uniref:DUF669 domain-containing protein n=2 Tax=unclassified Bacillus (in: firmicutes) TaxID=185979 RepID=UPI001BE5E936|nr:DUF669 domain-containing protein [Bacillus sp. ISL-78]MBT2615102.1 DUF669 domain-containing protein [Bacillus sp. ISL-78]